MAPSLPRAALLKLHCPWVRRGLVLVAGLVALGLGLGLHSTPSPKAVSGCVDATNDEASPGYASMLGRAGCR